MLDKLFSKEHPRSLKLPQANIDFSSNDYLGLARSGDLAELIKLTYNETVSRRNGSTGSRLLSGNSILAEETEAKLASFFGCEETLIFNSGYTANLSVLSTLPQRNDTVIMDELCHASIKDGARLSLATKWNFRHNDLTDLEQKLRDAKGHRWIVVESIYSMDGDKSPLKEISELAAHYDACIILDEAHSTGVLGPHGDGFASELRLTGKIDVIIYTFGKAMGIHGACVAGPSKLKNFLINYARPFIYTTGPDDHAYISIQCAFNYLSSHPELRDELTARISYFRKRIAGEKGFTSSPSQIQAFVTSDKRKATNLASILQSADFDVRPILPPTVREGTERLRLCVHNYNTEKEIDQLIELISKNCDQ